MDAKSKHAFTLVEVVTAIIIVAVLANIAVSRIQDLIAKARCAEAVTTLGAYEHLQDTYLGIHGVLGSPGEIGLELPAGGYFTYTPSDVTLDGRVGGGGGGKNPKNVDVCHMAGASKCVTVSVDTSGWTNGLAPQGDALGACDASCNGMLRVTKEYVLYATINASQTLYCKMGDVVYSKVNNVGEKSHGNTKGDCGRYMGYWFRN